jgi:hypothetical protein
MLITPLETLSANFQGRVCQVTRREFDWNFHFGDSLNVDAPAPWRVVTADGIAHSADDDGEWFGLPQPVDGERRTNDLLQGQRVVRVELDEQTADLRLVFDGGARLDFFNNSAGYEGWGAEVRKNGQRVRIQALGGGKLTTN